ncbi:MAG TPA: flavoprotein, partial [Bacteroidota bacterium]|nr:flavoprotein [Bacteroidota bacterium]
MRIVLGITGSSGAVYAEDFLKRCPGDKFLIISKWGKALLKDELKITEKDLQPYIKKQFANDDLTAPLASGTNRFDAYVILPCSTSTLGKIASGIGDSLITRAAAVALKER